MTHQRVSKGLPTGFRLGTNTAKENAVAGVKARNGADRGGPRKKTDARNKGKRPALASALVAILDRHGMVLSVVGGRSAARSFMMEAAR